tara:strand:+ start:18466 stop:19530 length:1065 start_codon:yes stop_codon:yes gene_type:complete
MTKKNKETILENISIKNAVKKMDLEKLDSLVVQNSRKKVIGVFTMGDFRRAVFKGLDINTKISSLINKEFKFLTQGYSKKEAKQIFIENDLILDIPVLDKRFKLTKVIKKKEVFNSKLKKKFNLKNFSVFIMAGGKGTRLDPFTRILPKPLIPYGNEPILKIIMDDFKKFGFENFFISIFEKKNMIKAYFSDNRSSYKINFVEEKKPLGTAGSLKLIANKLKKTFIVTNCDILIFSNYLAIIDFHKKNNYDLTLISSIRNHVVPYGVCETDNKGELKKINEKPEYNFFVNTGFYIIEPKVIKLIPTNKQYNMNELINAVKKRGMKVGVFPVSEGSWIDIGQWDEYHRNTKYIKN